MIHWAVKAAESDLPEIYALQRLAFQCEAEVLNDWQIQPLTETLEEIQEEFDSKLFLKTVDSETGKIVGSIRGYEENGTLFMQKLIVHPDFRRRGIALALIRALEERIPHRRSELFTRADNWGNRALYERAGFRPFQEKEETPRLTFVFFEK